VLKVALWAKLGTLLAALGALAGCDDGTVITRVTNFTGGGRDYVIPFAAGGLPTEIHGAPFAGVTADEVAAKLRLPPRFPAAIRFRAVAPGAGVAGRLVLAFNPEGPPNGMALCAPAAPKRLAPPRAVGFAVTATLCNGERVLTTGHLEAPKTRADDPQAFSHAMTRLFTALFEGDSR